MQINDSQPSRLQLRYAAITFQYDPETDTDHIYTRQELESGSLSEAYVNQDLMLKHLEPGASYRSYIQVRHYTRKLYRTDHLENIVEVTL